MNLAAALLVVLAGLAVGATSIGGILVVPALTAVAGMPVREAIAASNFSFLFTGAAALAMQRSAARAATTGALPPLGMLYVSALVGAALGSLTLQWLPAALVRLVVAFLAVLSGAMALRPGDQQYRAVPGAAAAHGATRGPVLLVLGLAVGCASAWSGTGGPVLLLPLLLLMRAPTPLSIAMAQGIQLPIAGAATAVNLAAGQLDLGLGILLGLLLMVGWAAGWAMVRGVSVVSLRRILALGLIAVGLWYGWQTL